MTKGPVDTVEDTTGHEAAPQRLPAADAVPDRHTFAGAADLLRALSSPVRAEVVARLDQNGAMCVHELVDALDLAQPLVSQHLRILRMTGIVVGDRRGREVEYRLVDQHVVHIVADALAHSQEPLPG